MEEHSRDRYADATKELEKAVYLMAHAGANIEVGMVLFWPYMISDSIMADIQATTPHAMVLLAYYAVFLRILEPGFWFMRGWSTRLFAKVDEHLAGNPAFLEAVKWPREQVFERYAQY